MDTESEVARHYAHGALEQTILEALKASGKDPEHFAPGDLSGIDEFHFGWRPATAELGRDLGLSPGIHLLDVGSGIGGPARSFAEAHGCRVTGIDLTEEFVSVANSLTRRCGLAERISFRQGSALSLPFPDAGFDAVTLIHVGMNIERKDRLFAEMRRVLKPSGRCGVYDIMRVGEGDIPFPEPWASSTATSFVESPETYRKLIEAAGFRIESETDRRELALRLVAEARERNAREGTPALGPHILMGAATRERLGNAVATVEAGTLAPVQIIARAA